MVQEVIRKHKRTNLFIIDQALWNWAQYEAKNRNLNSVSEYIFRLIKLDKEKHVLAEAEKLEEEE